MSFLDYFRQPEGLENLSPREVQLAISDENTSIIDVRSDREFSHGHIRGAKPCPLGRLDEYIPEIQKNKQVVLICATGHRSRAAAAKLLKSGFTKVSHLEGGMRSWVKAGNETTNE